MDNTKQIELFRDDFIYLACTKSNDEFNKYVKNLIRDILEIFPDATYRFVEEKVALKIADSPFHDCLKNEEYYTYLIMKNDED